MTNHGDPSDPRARHIPHHISSLLLRLGTTAPSLPEVEPGAATSGSISFEPVQAVAGEWGVFTLTYTVGDQPIEELGGIRAQLPEPWHAGIRNSAFRVHASQPREPNFVAARSSRSDVVLQTHVELEAPVAIDKGGRWSNLTGRSGYYTYVTRVIVRHGSLQAGDTISIVYGDTSRGSRGFRVGLQRTGPLPVHVAVDHDGSGRFLVHDQRPALTIVAGEPVDIFATANSDATAGELMALKLSLVDENANPAAPAEAHLTLEVVEGSADLPASADVPSGLGWLEVPFVPRAPGVLRIRATDAKRGISATSNPIRVHDQRPATAVYWGDLHSHTEVSGDGIGTGQQAYEFARRVVGLDFYSRTDHNSYFEDGASGDYGEYVRLADEADAPGVFTALHGYEVSFGSPYGHHNVYFRDRPVQVGDSYSTTLPEIWKALRGRQALTVPHHTMKMPSTVDWSDGDDPEQRRNFEIYSAHGLSEEFDPYHPLAFEQSLFTDPSTTQRNGTSAQRAWEDGLHLSTIASSDDHRSQPGLPHHGVVAVRATGLTRAEVFDAMYARRTYATTGVRILLDFSVGGIEMGGMGSASRPIRIRTTAVGTDVIERAELLRLVSGRRGFRVVAVQRPRADRLDWELLDDPGPGGAIYYVRLRQRGLVRGVVAMAWSSPVWIAAAADTGAGT